MLRKYSAVLLALALSGCYPGDPRTTEIENRTSGTIHISFQEKAFSIGGAIDVAAASSGDLWPNYRLSDLTSVDIREGQIRYTLEGPALRHLQRFCPKFCTLTYNGKGAVTVREWEGFKS